MSASATQGGHKKDAIIVFRHFARRCRSINYVRCENKILFGCSFPQNIYVKIIKIG